MLFPSLTSFSPVPVSVADLSFTSAFNVIFSILLGTETVYSSVSALNVGVSSYPSTVMDFKVLSFE